MADSVSSAIEPQHWAVVVKGVAPDVEGLGLDVADFVKALFRRGVGVQNADITFGYDIPTETIAINVTLGTPAREFTEFDHTDSGHTTANNPAIGTGTVGPGYLSSPADDRISDYGE